MKYSSSSHDMPYLVEYYVEFPVTVERAKQERLLG